MKYYAKTKAAELKQRFGNKDRRMLAWLGGITILTHFHWLFTFKIFTSGDWWFLSLDKYRDFITMSPVWVTDGFGGTSATPGFYAIRFFEGILTSIGSNFAVNEKLFFFLPIMLAGTFGTYIFLRQYFKEWLSFVGAIVFAFNTAMLFNYAGALTIAVADALTPLTLFCFRQLLKESGRFRWLIATAASFTVMALYEMRIALLVIAIAGGFFVFMLLTNDNKKAYFMERVGSLARLAGLLFVFQAFWLIPYIIGSRSGVTFSDLLDQNLFVSFSDIQNALTLRHPFWTNARPATFVPQPIPLYAWLIPLVAFGGLLFRRRHTNPEIGYWALLAIAGLFLVKQVNEPLVNAYPWIFAHIPGFAAFRESSKFYLLVSLSYAVLIPYTLAMSRAWLQARVQRKLGRVRWSSVLYATACGIVLLLFAVNMKPLLTGEFRTLYVARHMPGDYATLNSFIQGQPEYFRVMWLPTVSRWAAQNSKHPTLNATNIQQGEWLTRLSEADLPGGATLRDKATNVFKQQISDTFLDRASVKYVVVPLRDMANEDDFFRNYGDDRQYYLDLLDQQPYLRRVDVGTRDVAVYENRLHAPHVSAAHSLQTYDLAGSADTDALAAFTTKQLGQDFNFVDRTTADKTPHNYPSTTVINPFQDPDIKEVNQGGVAKTIAPLARPTLYTNTALRELRYEFKKNVFTLYQKPRGNLIINGEQAPANAAGETVVARQNLVPGGAYILKSADSVILLDTGKDSSAPLGVPKGDVALYAATGGNTVPDNSFEQGLWQNKVGDCNRYDNEAFIDMGLTKEASEGQQALLLEADKHTACTQTGSGPVNSETLFLRLDHRVEGGQRAGYELIFNDPKKTKVKHDINSSGTWQTEQRLISVPTGATAYTLRLFGYPDYRFRNHAMISYDNIHVLPAARLLRSAQPAARYTTTPLPGNQEINLSYPKTENGQGLNRFPNGSFTSGLWQKKVGDCNNYDNNPALGMKLAERKDTPEATKALELQAKRHAACTSQEHIPVRQGKQHLFSFDYQSPNASRASYTLTFNDPGRTKIEGSLPIKDAEWQTFTRQIQPPLGASEVSATVYAYGGDSGSEIFTNRYSNFRLVELPTVNGEYYVVDSPPAQLKSPRSITSQKRGSTRETIHVKGATTPFYLAQSESYNPLWRLTTTTPATHGALTQLLPWKLPDTASSHHFRLNDFQNGWYVDPAALCASSKGCTKNNDGSYDLELTAEFLPQRWFYMGSVISFTAIMCLVAYLLYSRAAKRRRRGHH